MKSWNLSSRMLMSLPAMPKRIGVAAAALIALAASPAMGQGFNLDLGTGTTPTNPLATYPAAAAQPGTWQGIPSVAAGVPVTLTNIAGVVTTATLTCNNANASIFSDNPLTLGDDGTLLDDFLDLGATGSIDIFTIAGLAAGTYEVYSYAWASDAPTFTTSVSVNGQPAVVVGGAAFAGLTTPNIYALHTVSICAGQNLVITTTAVTSFGSFNGVQIKPIGPPALPANDNCNSRIPISNGATPFCTVGATTDGLPLPSCDADPLFDIWYNYTATCTGSLTISLCGSLFDTALAVYDNCALVDCPPTPIDLLACNDDNGPSCAGTSSSVIVPVTMGQCLKLRVGGFSGTGAGTINISCAAPCPTGLITIPAGAPGVTTGPAAPYPGTLAVSGMIGVVNSVTVTLEDLTHTFPSDIDILLVGPRGQKIMLMSDAGAGLDVVNVDLTIADGAPAFTGAQIVSGTFAPTNIDGGDTATEMPAPAPSGPYSTSLASLINTNPNGTWSLFVRDDVGGDVGTIGCWSLTITTGAPLPVPNDACASAAVASIGTVAGTTLGATNDGSATCDPGGASSRDVWYSFTTTSAGTLSVNTCGSTIDTALAVLDSCGGLELACNDECGGSPCGPTGSCLSLFLNGGQSVRIRVSDKGLGSGGNFMITTSFIVAGDTCATALPLTCGVPAVSSLAGTTNDYQLSGGACFTGVGQVATTALGRDIAYSFIAPSTGKYSFKVQSIGAVAGGNLVLYVSNNQCPQGTLPAVITACLGAANRNTLTAPFTASEEVMCLPLVGGQQVYVFVDELSLAAGGGPFMLEAIACTQEIEPNGTTATATALGQGMETSINPIGDIDFFSLGTPAAGTRLFAAMFNLSGNNIDSQLRVTTATDTLEFDNDDGDTAPLGSTASVVAGTPMTGVSTFLRVTNTSATVLAEPWRIYSVIQPDSASAIAESEPNDTIATADTDPSNYYTGTMSALADLDIYSFTAAAGDMVFLALDCDPTRTGNPFNGSLSLLDSAGLAILSAVDGNAASSTVASPGVLTGTTPASPAEGIVFRIITAGTYYARVGAAGTFVAATSDYLLSVALIPNTCAPNAPTLVSNDACATPIAMVMGETVNGNTTFATHDGSATCDPGGLSSRDMWYSITIAAGQIPPGQGVRFNTCGSVIDTVLSVYTGTCGAPVEIGCNDQCGGFPCGGGDSCITFSSGLAAGTYLIRVSDQGIGSGGRFRLNVSLTNDSCADAFIVTANQSVIGTLAGAQNDYFLASGATCFTGVGQVATTGPGRDVAFQFTAPSNGSYSIRAQNLVAGGNLALYVTDNCLPASPDQPAIIASCLGAANRTTGAAAFTAAEEIPCLPLLRGQVIFIIVDEVAVTTTGGLFILDVARCTAEIEPNGTTATAGLVNNDLFGSIVPGADVDFYVLGSPSAGSRIFAAAFGITSLSADTRLRITTTTDTLEFDDDDGDTNMLGGFAPTIDGTIAPGGTDLFIRVDHFTQPTGQTEPYRLFSKIQPPSTSAILESEPNDTIATADSDPSNYFTGLMSAVGDLDIYSFTAEKGDIVFAGLDNDPTRTNNPFNGNLELLDSAGAIIISALDANAASSTVASPGTLVGTTPASPGEAIVFKIITTGTYYVRVRTTALLNVPDYLLSIAITSDENPPVISGCPKDIEVGTDPGACSAVVSWTEPTAQDDVHLMSFTSTHEPGDTFLQGTPTTVTYTAIDRAGNQSTCSFTVTVTDDEFPVLAGCPRDIFTGTDPGFCSADVSWTPPVFTDNCPGTLVVVSSHDPGDTFLTGDTTVTYTATDRGGNVTICTFDVSVVDDEVPTITCPPPVPVGTDPGVCTASSVSLGLPLTGDNCGVLSVTNNAPGTFPLGPTTVIWTVTDINGLTNTCSQLVTVTDDEPPVITQCAVDETVVTPTIPNLVPQVTATDNCTGPLVVTQSPLAGAAIVTENTIVTLTVTDAAGLTDTCTAVVTLFIPLGPSLVLAANPSCGGLPGDPIVVTLSMADLCPLLTSGFQAFLEYDPTKLQFVSGSYNLLVFGLPVITPITASSGTISLAAGINQFGGQTPVCADATLVTLNFIALVEDCGTTSVAFREVGPATIMSDPFGAPIAGLVLNDLSAVVTFDGTPPVITCPGNFTVSANAGGCTATLPLASLLPTSVSDACDPTPRLTFNRSDGALTVDAPFPCGVVTTVAWTATDDCENFSSCSFTVLVACNNQMLTNITLSPTMVAGPITRCITFQFFDCVGIAPDAIVVQNISFTNGSATNVVVTVPCGNYTCVNARDRLHSLRRTVNPGISGSQYTANFTGPDQLVGGNLNDDVFIDILDFGVFIGQHPGSYGSGSTNCGTVAPHADINGDSIVSLPDFTYIQVNFLQASETNCCVVGPIMADGPISRITLAELHRRGLGGLAVADLNIDGVLDQLDVAAFMGGAVPGGHHFIGAAAAEPGSPEANAVALTSSSWFDAANWSAPAGLPDETVDVTLYSGVTIDQDGAVARHLTIAEGGSLTITDGSLTVKTLTVASGGTLSIIDPGSLLAAAVITIEPGAAVIWADGVIIGDVVNAGQMTLGPSTVTSLRLDGDFTQLATGFLAIELGLAAARTDAFTILGDASLGGTLNVSLTAGFFPQPGDSLPLIAANAVELAFDDVAVPLLASGTVDASVSETEVTLIVVSPSGVLGDLDGNGIVNSLDLGIVLAAWGSCDPCASDLDHNGTVNNADLGILLAQWEQ